MLDPATAVEICKDLAQNVNYPASVHFTSHIEPMDTRSLRQTMAGRAHGTGAGMAGVGTIVSASLPIPVRRFKAAGPTRVSSQCSLLSVLGKIQMPDTSSFALFVHDLRLIPIS